MLPIAILIAGALSLAQSPSSDFLISTSDLAKQLRDPATVVLYIADREGSYLEEHIPGARFVLYSDIAVNGATALGSELPPMAQLKRVFETVGVSDSSRVVIYGANTVYAARAFFTLDAVGHTRVALLDGGLPAWKTEKRPVESGTAAKVNAGTFTPKLNAVRVVDASFVQQQTGTHGIALLDVRPDPEYFGTDGGMNGMHTPGHIAGAVQMPWTTLVGPDGRFLSRDALEAKFRAAGVKAGTPVVSYCMVGMRASVAYFVARYLGYDARLYDGSIVDWSQRKLPTTTGRQEH